MSEWAEHVRMQARLIVDQIADLHGRLPSRDKAASALSRYYAMLEELFDTDMRLAQLRDTSDLLLRAEGDAFNHDPRLQLVTAIFSNVTSQVSDLTEAILGARTQGRVKPSGVDLGLSGIARGSLYFGLIAQQPEKDAPLLGATDPYMTLQRERFRSSTTWPTSSSMMMSGSLSRKSQKP